MNDYRIYRLSFKENIYCLLLTGVSTASISWLFYHSFYGLIGGIPLFFLIKRKMKHYLYQKRKREMLFQFREMLQFMSGALKAGNAMEHAVFQALQEFKELYGKKAVMAMEFHNINRQIGLNIPLEKLMEDLALRSGIEEINSFVQVFAYAKRGGGDMMKIFQDTVEKIRQKSDVERQIQTVLAAKRMEQHIMELVPFGILIYVGLASPDFLKPLYGNLTGIIVMTVCLLAYAGAFLLAEKILDIQV